MTRAYKKRVYGKRGPYKKRSSFSARRSTSVKAKKSSPCAERPDLKKLRCSPLKKKAPPSPKRWKGESSIMRTAITLAMNKLLQKPKNNQPKQAGKRVCFWTIGYEECKAYMLNHPAACKLPADTKMRSKCIPSRPTYYRILTELGWSSSDRTRDQRSYFYH